MYDQENHLRRKRTEKNAWIPNTVRKKVRRRWMRQACQQINFFASKMQDRNHHVCAQNVSVCRKHFRLKRSWRTEYIAREQVGNT